ncbi:hypothetical protein ARMSODRAFT_968270 [Armillaria solidipes]|uniref:Uncharacterized protein n=1 Tax=Armillaria solidipes TaxID=1076256 RepID=A0A2H3C4N2_9AGAR|nr:hypothetical protein ARMSODRAFT_968270 [Armillaria solidipes]
MPTKSPMMPLLESPISLVSTRPVPRSRLLTRRRGSHPFDSLPWIDILDSPPDESMANLGDLSQLGPVRRHRKARSSPLSRPRRLPSSSPSPPPASLPPALLERCSTPPPPTTRPSYVIFHDLMPQL